eukprot:scaffold26578_cov92-Amphora_coffeaeformis.AAC.1
MAPRSPTPSTTTNSKTLWRTRFGATPVWYHQYQYPGTPRSPVSSLNLNGISTVSPSRSLLH